MQDYRAFRPVTVLSRQLGVALNIGTAYDAAHFLLYEWPAGETGAKHLNAKVILRSCLAGECSAAVARVAFIEAAREANLYVQPPENEPVKGNPTRSRKAKAWPRPSNLSTRGRIVVGIAKKAYSS